MKKSIAIAAAAAGLVLAQPAVGQTDDTKLGKVHFETSCRSEAQKHFDRAMLYQHSFWYRASQMAFEDVLKADPECAMAYWGIALSLDGSKLYAANGASDDVSVVDVKARKELKRIKAGSGPWGIAIVGAKK